MTTLKQAAADFLACRRIAVTGVSRTPKGHGSNVVYQRLRNRGYEVVAINPNADHVEGDRCYPDLKSVPHEIEAVVIATRAETAEDTMRECVDLGIKRVWMHRLSGAGSVSPVAAQYGREHGITVIDGGCPLMFPPTSDAGHRVMRLLTRTVRQSPRNARPQRGAPPVPLSPLMWWRWSELRGCGGRRPGAIWAKPDEDWSPGLRSRLGVPGGGTVEGFSRACVL